MYGDTLGPLIGDVGYVSPAGLGYFGELELRRTEIWEGADELATDAIVNQQPIPQSSSTSTLGDAFANMLRMAREAAEAAQAAAQADIQAAAEGRPQPSELEPTVDVRIGSELVTGVPIGQAEAVSILEGPAVNGAPVAAGIAEEIAASQAGDLVESIGLPRASAPWLIGALALGGIVWGIQAQGG